MSYIPFLMISLALSFNLSYSRESCRIFFLIFTMEEKVSKFLQQPRFFEESIISLLKIKLYSKSEILTKVHTRFAPSRPYLGDQTMPEGAAERRKEEFRWRSGEREEGWSCTTRPSPASMQIRRTDTLQLPVSSPRR